MAVALLLAAAGCTAGEQNASAPMTAEVAGTEHVCSSCHGLNGKSVNPTFPNLAGQQKDYLEAQLKAFRDHTRADPHAHTYMWGMAAQLSDSTIDGLAQFFSSQAPAEGSSENSVEVAAGKKIFDDGIAAKDVPPCMACHGEKAEGNITIPRLAGQHRSYLEGQLEAFAVNSRANEIMHQNSMNLSAQEISEVTAFLAAQ